MNNIKSNFFYSYHVKNRKWKNIHFSLKTKIFFWLIFFIVIIVSMIFVGFNFSKYGFNVFSKNLKEIFYFDSYIKAYPNYSLWSLSFMFLWQSIQAVIVGTTIGFIVALFTSYLSNSHFIKSKLLNNIIQILLAILRALPTIVFIYFFRLNFGSRASNVALYLLYGWFSWLWIHKYMVEIYDSLNYYPYYTFIKQGFNKFISFFKVIFFQVNNKFISLYLYSFESNMRWVSLLGTLGFIGIGQLINYASDNNYQNMGIPVLIMMLFMLFLEVIIFVINRFLLNYKSYTIDKNIDSFYQYINWRTIVKIVLFFILIISFIVCLILLSIDQYADFNNSFTESLFNPNWEILNTKKNLVSDIFMLFFQSISIMFIATIIALLLIFISSYKLFKYYSIFGIGLSAIIRSFPVVALFYIINPLYTSPVSSICIILAIGSATVIAKNITESINKIDNKIINYYLMQGYLKISIFFKYILFYIKQELLTLILFEYESKFRDLITYGSYGASSIGASINDYQSKGNYINMAPFIWISFFITLFVIFSNYLLKFFILEKKTINLSFNNLIGNIKGSMQWK